MSGCAVHWTLVSEYGKWLALEQQLHLIERKKYFCYSRVLVQHFTSHNNKF